VANSLPVALARLGHRVTVVSPLYTFVKDKFCIDEANSSSAKQAETDKNDHKGEEFHLRLRCVCEGIKLHMAESGIQHVKFWGTRWRKVDWIFVDHPCYMREGGPYGDGQEAFVDNAFRFSLLSLAAVELPLQWWSQVERRDTRDDAILFIANDWHASMVPVYLACKFRSNRVLENCRSLFTIHNLMHQGVQHPSLYSMLGLGNEHYHWFDYPTNNLVFDTPTLAASQQQGWLEMDNAASANANASPSLVPSSSLMDSDYDTNTYGSNNSGNGPGGGGGNVGVLDMMLQEDTLDAYQTSGEACINMLVGALRTCDRVVTVSSTYAWEICEKNSFGFGFGLQRELLKRRDDIYGITNGIDTEEWDPETDPHIHPHNYGKDNLLGKLRCKQSLARELYLDDDIGIPMIGFVGRLDKQKGADVLLDALPKILNNNSSSKVHVVLLGSGDEHLETRIRNAQKSFPNHFRGILEFNVALSHQIIAACDMLVMPSRFEPCGLNQLFSLRYGTIPIVHRVGGLSDTVEDFNPVGNKLRGSGTGWSFKPCNANKLTESVMLALSVMKGNREREGKLRGNLVAFPPSDHSSHHSNNSGDDEAGAAASTQVYSKSWLRLMQRCMNCEHSWPLAAYQYQMLMRWTMHSQSHLKEPHTLSKT
jgi:glycogen synthase